MGRPGSSDKPFAISKMLVWEAYRRVAANKGAPGVDEQSIAVFETDLQDNLYKIWNRMASGSYFPPPVRAVEIAKPHGGGSRVLGVPTVADRVAQTTAAMALEPLVEPMFHQDSYGYRPGRSALDAVAVCRRRCQQKNWVIDCDVEKFFDTVPWDLIIKAVEAVGAERWVVLYVTRWLAAPEILPDGARHERDRGTPQGSPISPVLANLFMHYAFDAWMGRQFATIGFERYCDDMVVHCVSERQARHVRAAIEGRLARVGLRLHPAKTQIVYCQDSNRRGDYAHTSFTFLGYTFRPRRARSKHGVVFTAFLPAISDEAVKAVGREIRCWRMHRCVTLSLDDLADWINPIVRGWIQFYGRFYPAAMYPLLKRINTYLVRWARRKYKRLRGYKRLSAWWRGVTSRDNALFVHWRYTCTFEWTR